MNEGRVMDILNNTDCETCEFKPTCNYLKQTINKSLCESLDEDMKNDI